MSVKDALEVARRDLKVESGYTDAIVNNMNPEMLLTYIPYEYFGKEHVANHVETEYGRTWYLVGPENWNVTERFVEYVIENGVKRCLTKRT